MFGSYSSTVKVLPFRAGDLLFNFWCHRVQNYKNILKEKDLCGGEGLTGRKEGRLAKKGLGKDLFGFVCPFC